MTPMAHRHRTLANERTHLLLGDVGIKRLSEAHVLVAGVGGVGGNCVEALARAGVGKLTLVDFDRVVASNCNRQVVALHSTLDCLKVEVMAERARDIQPGITLVCEARRLSPPEIPDFLPEGVDVVLDCIDAITSKVALYRAAQERGIFVAGSMGAAARLDPSQVRVGDLYETHGCPMATAVRKLARRWGVQTGVRAVFSPERPLPHPEREFVPGAGPQKTVNGTISYMPPIFGLMLAAEGIRYLLGSDMPGGAR
ncbi:MAG: tRNA threonylcarbamoyladenosine dehydratase [bacterium]|nr:tRNA threonylcarbamoyladenosine dehydratase [bacterium]